MSRFVSLILAAVTGLLGVVVSPEWADTLGPGLTIGAGVALLLVGGAWWWVTGGDMRLDPADLAKLRDEERLPWWIRAVFVELAQAAWFRSFVRAVLDAIERGPVRPDGSVDRASVQAAVREGEAAADRARNERRARCPWWAPLAAALPVVGMLAACGGPQPVATASESVAGTITGAASFDCDAGGCEREGVGTAQITATADVCLDLFGGPVFCWPMTVDASAFVTDDRAEAVVCVESAPFVKPACVSTAGE